MTKRQKYVRAVMRRLADLRGRGSKKKNPYRATIRIRLR